MKTNQLMRRPMGQFEVLQRTSDGFFNATELFNQWNKANPNNERRLDKFWDTTHIKNFLYAHGNDCYTTERGKYNGGTWMKADLFLESVKYINTELYVKMKNEFIKEEIINGDITSNLIRMETQLLSALSSALDVVPITIVDRKYYKQYSCLNGKYRIDMLIAYQYEDICEDGEKCINKSFSIIEYDEAFHERHSIEDKEREIEIAKEIYHKAKEEENIDNNIYVDVNIEILRIKEGKEGFFYAYAIPYFTGIDTSTCSDDMRDNLDFRTLYSDKGSVNTIGV